jgi:hypothetical protein
MNGWVSQLHARGNLAGVYGSTLCNTGLSDFRTITNVPDVIWPARWYHNAGSGAYDPNATVWDLGSCLPNTVWANHQRIRQYEGDHNETWGNLTLGIDNNVLDGVVAIPYIFPFVSGIVRADDNPTSAVSVDFTVTFSESVMDVEAVDFALTTAGVIGASIIDVSGSDHIYTVTVNTGSGNGTLRLDIPVTADITDLDGDTLGGLPFTGGETYTIDKTPTAASLVSPSGSIGANYNPVYTWNEVPSATWYYLWVNGPNGNIIKHWVEASTGCNSGTCSVTPSATLSGGAHTWWIQTWNPAGYGPWSLGKEFSTLSLGAATLTSPNGNIGTTYAPSFSWDHVPGTTWYYVWVNGPSGNVVKKWYESSTICSAGTCTTASPTTLGGGNHTWWVRTWNSAGYGPWSSGMNFNTTIPTIPTAATLVSPTGSGGLNPPTYTWNKVTGVTWYYVWVNSSSGNVFKQWYEASAVCGASTCSVTQPSSLANGSYVWWVQTWNSAGYGPWSSSMNFSIP